MGRSVGPYAVGLYQPASWLQQRAGPLQWRTWQACRYLISPCVFNHVGRWLKWAGCSSSMQLPLPTDWHCMCCVSAVQSFTKSSCSGPTGRKLVT